jgi:hypothetical protein
MIALTLLAAGDPARAELDEIRAALTRLTAEREEIAGADVPASEAFERAMERIRLRADAPENSLAHFVDPDPWPPGESGNDLLDPWARQWNLAPEVFEKQLRAYFDRICTTPGLPAAKRAARIRDIDREVAELRDRAEFAWLDLFSRNLLAERPEIEGSGGVDRVLRLWDQVAA